MLAIPVEIYDVLEQRLGREDALAIAKSIDEVITEIERRSHEIATQRKIEVKEELRVELRDELVTKADLARSEGTLREEIARVEGSLREEIARVEGSLREEIARLDGKVELRFAQLEKQMNTLFLITIFTVILLNKEALTLLGQLLGLIK